MQARLGVEVFDQAMVYISTWFGDSAPALNAGTENNLHALRTSDGGLIWSIPGKYFILNDSWTLSGIVLTHTTGGLTGLNAQTGAVKWTWTSAATDGSNWSLINGKANQLYYGDESGVYALNEQSGQMLWHRNIQSAIQNIVTDDQQLYINDQLHILAVNKSNGKLRWRIPVEGVAQFVYCPPCSE